MGKVYVNSLMVIFNSRVVISDLRDEPRLVEMLESVQSGACPIERRKENPNDMGFMSTSSSEGRTIVIADTAGH